MNDQPQLIAFNSFGTIAQGFLTVAEYEKHIPFPVQRVFWIYHIPHMLDRGGHAHKALYQLLVAVSGVVVVDTESVDGMKKSFTLDTPEMGLLMPPPFWHTMRFSHTGVLISLASAPYSEDDYIRNYQDFKNGR